MRGKSPLVIMELCIMLLVFAMAAALCLGAFALADGISRDAGELDRASLMAGNCAEALRAAEGDMEAAAAMLGGEVRNGTLELEAEGLSLRAERTESPHPLMAQARVEVCSGEGEELIALDCAWQEGGGHD